VEMKIVGGAKEKDESGSDGSSLGAALGGFAQCSSWTASETRSYNRVSQLQLHRQLNTRNTNIHILSLEKVPVYDLSSS